MRVGGWERLYRDPLMAVADMTTERGAWRGLRYDITDINRCLERRSISSDPIRSDLLAGSFVSDR